MNWRPYHWYPEWVFSKNEDITRRNMAEYDRKMDQTFNKCRELNPEYDRLPMQERFKVYCKAHDIVFKREA